jgi:ribosome recycling factor
MPFTDLQKIILEKKGFDLNSKEEIEKFLNPNWERDLFDGAIIKDIEKAIMKAELGIAPNSDGTCIRLTFPPLTEDRRKEIVKEVKKLGEESKVAIRNVRRDMVDDLKKLEKSENLPEDLVKDKQDEIQKLTDKYTGIVEKSVEEKEKEVMTV